MTDLADAFLALPGGIGTLDELFEAWSWNALGYHAKPFCLLNVDGFWDGLIEFIDHATQSGFLSPQRRAQLLVATTPDEALKLLDEAAAARYARHGLVRAGRACEVLNQKLLGIAGIVAILALAWLVSTNRKAIRLRVVGAAFALQAAIAFLVLWTSWGRAAIQWLSTGVANLLGYATKGTEFLFGPSDANPLAHTFAIAALAGDHLLREPGRDPLLSRDHAADRPLGRRRDRLGDRHQPGRIA